MTAPIRKYGSLIIVFSALFLGPERSAVAEPGWSPVIIATGAYREQIRATPIELRPYRPFHIYGNTVRRIHYRGTPLPIPRRMSLTRRPDQPVNVSRPLLGPLRRR
jgi:hypothetical protein